MSGSLCEGGVTESMYDFRLVGLGPWGSSCHLSGIYGHLVSADDSRDDQAREVFTGETGLDEASSVVDDEVLLLVEEDLHLFEALLDSSHYYFLIFISYFINSNNL